MTQYPQFPIPSPLPFPRPPAPVIRRAIAVSVAGLSLIAASCSGGGGDSLEREVEPAGGSVEAELAELTGARTRVVWTRHQGRDPQDTDTYQSGRSHVLMGLDTHDGQGERVILGDRANYSKPMITPGGDAIVFSNKNITRDDQRRKRYAPVIHTLPWGGGADDVREVAKGFAVDVWRDPETGRDWVFAVDDIKPSTAASLEARRLFKFPLDDPDKSTTLYKGDVSPDNIQLSRDGEVASGLFPWPDGGTIDLSTGKWRKTLNGCWASMAPDDSKVSWVFDGSHRVLRMTAPGGGGSWQTKINTPEEVGGREVYHPRWSNHPRFFGFTGPYAKAAKGRNPISDGGATAEVYVGRFSDDLRKLGASVKLTDNGRGDFFPDVWVAGGAEAALDGRLSAAAEPEIDPGVWPPVQDGLVFNWESLQADNRVGGRDCRVDARGIARFGPGLELLLDGGTFELDRESAAALAGASDITAGFEAVGAGGKSLGWRWGQPLDVGRLKSGVIAAVDGSGPVGVRRLVVFDRALGAAEREAVASALPEPEPAPAAETLRVKAKLLEAPETPPIEWLDTYRRALVDYTYEVEEVLEGSYADEKIVVLHWAILDRRFVSGLPREVGKSYELEVEMVEGFHPEIAGERRTSETSELLLEAYLDLSTPAGVE